MYTIKATPNERQIDLTSENEIQENLVYLSKNVTNLDEILLHLIQSKILTDNESQIIKSEKTELTQNFRFLSIIQKKGWPAIRSHFLQILHETCNGHCANVIEHKQPQFKFAKISRLKSKWFPDQKPLPLSFYERKREGCLLVEQLNEMLNTNENRMTVINQKVAVSGLGGIGKSTTAKWYAQHYQATYDHIIWIDCGEGSLLKSFTKLARVMKLEDRHELDLEEIAKECFEALHHFNCLWIFDNAECYVGNEGVRNVLPKNYKLFHVIITSRNKAWGNKTGDGEIPGFEMDVFTTLEGVDFMKRNIEGLVDGDETLLELLCELLGNLPLALQIAVAALNQKKVTLPEYIHRIQKSDYLLHENFDDYEKTVNKTMTISLDIIKKKEGDGGKLAHNILISCGYIMPDNVELTFFGSMEKKGKEDVNQALEILANYSLVSTSTIILPPDDVDEKLYRSFIKTFEKDVLSIHRLLQQVIRYNAKSTENGTLRKILSCTGQSFLDYKLMPYIYSSDNVQKEFPEIRAALIDELELNRLLVHRRFKEAMELSRFITDSVNSITSAFNYAVCRKINGEAEKAKDLLESLFGQARNAEDRKHFRDCFFPKGIIRSEYDLTKEIVAGQLFLTYWILKDKEKAEEIISKTTLIFSWSCEVLNHIFKSTDFFGIRSYLLDCYGSKQMRYISLTQKEERFGKIIRLLNCCVDKGVHFPAEVESLEVYHGEIPFEIINAKTLTMSNSKGHLTQNTQVSVQKAVLWNAKFSYISNTLEAIETEASNAYPILNWKELLHLEVNGKLIDTKSVEMAMLEPVDDERQIADLDKRLRLMSITDYYITCLNNFQNISLCFNKNGHGRQIELCKLNVPSTKTGQDYHVDAKLSECSLLSPSLSDIIGVSFNHLNYLKLEDMIIDLADSVVIPNVLLSNVTILNWESVNWTIDKLCLKKYSLLNKAPLLKVKELEMRSCSVDITCLPLSLEKLTMERTSVMRNPCCEIADETLPINLQHLTLEYVTFKDENEKAINKFDISHLIPPPLKSLSINGGAEKSILISIGALKSVPFVDLQDCKLLISTPGACICPIEIKTSDLLVARRNTDKATKFIDLRNLQKLHRTGVSIDMSESISLQEVTLVEMTFKDLQKAKWVVQKLNLEYTPFLQNSEMTVKEMILFQSPFDFSVLPKSIEKLAIEMHLFTDCSRLITQRIEQPNLQELNLEYLTFEDAEGEVLPEIDITELIPLHLKRLKLICYDGADGRSSTVVVSMSRLLSLQYLHLNTCRLLVSPGMRITPQELTLSNVKIVKENLEEDEVLVNEIADFENIQRLELEKMFIDLRGNVCVDYVSLRHTKVLDWANSNWSINLLHLSELPEMTPMKIKQIEFMKY